MSDKVDHGVTGALFGIGLTTLMAIYRYFVAQKLWLWFLTPIIGLTPPTIAVLFGLGILFQLFTYNATFTQYWRAHSEIMFPTQPWMRTFVMATTHAVLISSAWFVGWLIA